MLSRANSALYRRPHLGLALSALSPRSLLSTGKTEGPRIVIVGGVAGGATAAARARRNNEKCQITMIEKGADVSVATCAMPYFVGREVTDRSKLVMNTPDHLAQTIATDVRMSHEVVGIDRAAKKVDVVNLKAPAGSPGARFSVAYDKLIIATGASPTLPPIPGLKELYKNGRLVTLRTLEDMDRIVKRVSEAGPGGHVVVVGAGLIGMEMVEALAHCGMGVTVVEAQSSILPLLDAEMSAPITQELYNNGVRVVAGQKVVAFHDNSSTSSAAGTDAVEVQLETGERLKASFIIQSIGIRPDSQIAEAAGLKVAGNKSIVVNPYMQTSDPDIYAVGDVVSTPFVQSPKPTWLPLGGPANRQARIAADHILLGETKTQPYRGSFGTAIVRVFDTVAGKTGMTETECINAKKNYAVTIVNGYNHTSSYPNAMPITMKVLYDKDSGVLLGAQAVGGVDGVDKRLDVMATALAGGMTIDDLAHLDLAYAPPFGAARDIVNTAGFNGINVRQGLVRTVRDLQAAHDAANPAIVLDVRDAMSSSLRPVPSRDGGGCDGTRIVNIPFGELRGRIEELRSIVGDKPVITLCDHGKMSYFASRVLVAHGFDVQSLKGGVTNLPKKKANLLTEPKAKSTSSCTVVHGVAPIAPSAVAAASGAKNELLDVCGLACPGPIMQIRKMLPDLAPGSTLTVKASDPGFMNDFPAFCRASNLQCVTVEKKAGVVTGILRVPGGSAAATPAAAAPSTAANTSNASSNSIAVEAPNKNDLALVVFSGELDKVMAAFVMANGALALGGKVTMFFTFWGLNALRAKTKHHSKDEIHHHSSVMDKMLSMMLPKNADRLPLSHLNFGGVGAEMMKMQMKQKHLPNLPDLMKSAREGGARIVGCTMSMEALGVPADELIEGIELGGVADFLEASSKSKSTLFI